MRVLIVDDSPAMRAFITRVLGLTGLNIESVSEAGDGREALAFVQSGCVDLVLCDVNMPEMNGEQLLETMAQAGLPEKVCVVVVSTDATNKRVKRMHELGARGYLTKPFSPETMRDTLDRALGRAYA
jgi:two-component system, chemotaxis family, chemotaxis protein CheY